MNTKLDLSNYLRETFVEPSINYHVAAMGLQMPYLHWHPHYEILLITQGNYILVNNNHVISGTKPIAIIHCPYSLHNMNAISDRVYERHVITFNKQIIHKFSPETMDITPLRQASLIYTEPNPAEMVALTEFARQMTEYQSDSTMKALFIALILRRIMMICESGRGEIIRGNHSYIQDVLQYMPEHMSESLTAVELAKKFDVCIAKFHRDFRATVGKTYKQHLTDLRQTFARELLASGVSIVNAAIDTGYANEAHFIKAFREYWGVTPGEYRRKNEGCD